MVKERESGVMVQGKRRVSSHGDVRLREIAVRGKRKSGVELSYEELEGGGQA